MQTSLGGGSRAARFVALGLASVLMAGCSSSTSPSPAASGGNQSPAATAGGEPVHLGVLVQAGGPGDAVEALAAQYSKDHPDVTVEVSKLPYDNTRERALADFTAHQGAYDVVGFDYLWVKEYAKGGFLIPIDDLIAKAADQVNKDDFFKAYLDYATVDGKLYGLPWLAAVYMLYYRTDLLAKYGLDVPTTWDEYAATAKTLQEKAGLFGSTFIGKRDDPLVDEFWTIAWSYGAEIFDGHHATIDSPEALAAFKVWNDIFKTAAPDSLAADWPTVAASFAQGKSAMMLNFSDTSETLLGSDSTVADKVGFAAIPAGPTGKLTPNLGGWGMGINADSKNQQAAFDFLTWLLSADSQKLGLESGGSATRASVLGDPELQKTYPYFSAALENFKNAVPFPQATNWVDWEAAMAPPMSEALGGQRTLESGLQEAQSRLEAEVVKEFP